MEKLVLTERFNEALLWSIELHANQTRKGSEIPYASHLLGVAGLVMENTVDEDVVIAALLHDAVEDKGGLKTLDEIKKKYGEKVANIVFACSDSWETPKLPYEERKAAYIKNLPSHSEDAHLVSLADKLHNVRSMLIDYQRYGEVFWDRFTGHKAGSLKYYRSLVEVFKDIDNPKLNHLVYELERVIKSIENV